MTLFEALTGGAFDRLNWQHSGEFDQKFSKKTNARGFAREGAWAVLKLTGTLASGKTRFPYSKAQAVAAIVHALFLSKHQALFRRNSVTFSEFQSGHKFVMSASHFIV